MRTWTLPALLALATACAGADDKSTDTEFPSDVVASDTDTPSDTDDTEPTGSSDTDATDTELPESELDCGDGNDDDGDGLVDCEDGDCAEVCVEDCASEGDEDDDGLADCADDECWGLADCGGAQVQVTGGTLTLDIEKSFASWYHADRGYGSETTTMLSTYAIREVRLVQAEGALTGQVGFQTGSGTVSCGWGADLVAFYNHRSSAGSSVTSSGLSWAGFTTTGACGGLGSWFLPSAADFSNPRALRVPTSFAGDEPEWLQATTSTSTRNFSNSTFSTSTSTWGGQWTRGSQYFWVDSQHIEKELGSGEAFVWLY